MAGKMRKTTKDRIAGFFLEYVRSNGECTARTFISSKDIRKYNLTTSQFGNLFREYKCVEPYKSLIDCNSNIKGSTLYRYMGD